MSRSGARYASYTSVQFNAKDYGALGNGTVDDSIAIQAAIDAASVNGGTVTFPAGTYRAKNLLIKSNVMLSGVGIGGTTIKLVDGANVDLITVPNFASLTGTNSQAGEHHWGIDNMTLDANRANQTNTAWIMRVYAYCYTISDVEFLNGYNGGVYSEWSNIGGGDMEAHWERFKIIGSTGTNLDWKGPHDSSFFQGEVVSGQFPNYTETGIWSRGNAGGEVFVGVHVWGFHNYGWKFEHSCNAVACQAEGARAVNLLVKAGHVRWAGKVFGTDDYHTNEVGVQLGDTDFTGMVGSALDIDLNNFGPTSFPLKWVSTGGQNRITGRWWKGDGGNLSTGTADLKDDIEIVCADVPTQSVYLQGHQSTYTAYSGSWLWRGSGASMFNITATGNRVELVNSSALVGYKDLFTTPTLRLFSATGGIQAGTTAGSGSTEFSGSGVPGIAGTLGDRYWRTDTPSVSLQRLYMCTTTGGVGVAVWTAVL